MLENSRLNKHSQHNSPEREKYTPLWLKGNELEFRASCPHGERKLWRGGWGEVMDREKESRGEKELKREHWGDQDNSRWDVDGEMLEFTHPIMSAWAARGPRVCLIRSAWWHFVKITLCVCVCVSFSSSDWRAPQDSVPFWKQASHHGRSAR